MASAMRVVITDTVSAVVAVGRIRYGPSGMKPPAM
jgi:hypothetical protein